MESAREMEERFALVTVATGALGPVLVKLAALLGDEYNLQEGTRRGIESIKSELEPVHQLLWKLWGREDLDVACKDWMAEARELSYDMDDGIERETADGPLKEFMERVIDVSQQRSEMQNGGDAICNRSKLTTDPRALFLDKDVSELVGMEENKEEVIQLLQEHEMVCIVGSAGMGKTTLADLVYQTIGDEFQCRAFVSVHPNPNMTEILGTILSQVTDGAMSENSGTEPAVQQNDLIEAISNFLSDKRYLVIIDDIWHQQEWEVIRKALPKNDLRHKIIMTTRVRSIAVKCETKVTEQDARVYTQYFGRADAAMLSDMRLSRSAQGTNAKGLSTMIADMCIWPPDYFCPLAVMCLSSAWAESHPVRGDAEEYHRWASQVLYDGFLITPSLKPLIQSLSLGFDDLPIQLRTCLLYCTIYPPEYEFDKGCLVRKWIAEGFVSQVEVANSYLEELISRNLLVDYYERCTVPPVMRAFLVCKAKQDNFIAYYGGPGNSSHAKQIRRLCVTTGCCPDEDDVPLSHARSLVVCGRQCKLDCKAFQKLRVLEIRYCSSLENGDLVDICGLICLKYLGILNCNQITELPRQIGRLQHLESLYVARTHISKLPTEIKNLGRLETLDISWTRLRELPKEIRKLQHLRTLNMRGTKVRELPWEVENSINVLLGDWQYLKMVKLAEVVGPDRVISSSGANCRGALSIVFPDRFIPRCEALLRVEGRHMKVPQWVKQDLMNIRTLDISLCNLAEEDLEFLKTQMTNLQALQLRFEVLPREPVAITRGGFSKLEAFYVDCRQPRVTFKEGAMPKLTHLEFKFYSILACQDYSMGIKHLPNLDKVVFRCSEYYTSDNPGISATIEVVRKEATQHPNVIALYVNDMKPEVCSRGATWISLADKARKEFDEWEKEIERRERKIADRQKREERRLLREAAEWRAQQDKNNTRARIEKEIQERKSNLEIRERRLREAERK